MITIFTDGSSRGNPGPGGWSAILVSEQDDGSIASAKEFGGAEAYTTNNRMELTAAIEALSYALGMLTVLAFSELSDNVTVHSDSSYVINGATKWLSGWQRKQWITTQKQEVLNRDLWENLAGLIMEIKKTGGKLSWCYVGGHVGIPANERCDEIATAFADGASVNLYDGAKDSYTIDTDAIVAEQSLVSSKSSSKSRSRAKAYSYLSFINGKVKKYSSWAECEAEVKGKPGVKYKKALSAEDERAIIAEWQR